MSSPYKIDAHAKLAFLQSVESRLQPQPFPPQVIIETTAACNLTCAHCGHGSMERAKGHMPMALYRRIIDEIADCAPNTEVWPTFYGEAFLLDYRLYYMLRYATQRGLTNLILNTNGTRMTEEVADWVLDSGLRIIMFSLDGFTAPTFESIRRGARRDEVFANVERLLAMKARRGGNTPRVEVQYSMMDANEHEVDAFKASWLERGADVKVREKLTWTGYTDAPNLRKDLRRIACPWAIRTCAIHWNGNIVACAVDYEGRYVAGNVGAQSIATIWNRSHRHLQAMHLRHEFTDLPEPCRNCLDWQVGGGAQHFLAPGAADAR
jgi:radical SAM protein with 4Fe4S-binding SPASM domain